MVVTKRLLILSISALLLVVAPNSVAQATKCLDTYRAKRGDSWWSIAEKSNSTLKRVLKLNGATPSTRILIGDQICVPIENVASRDQEVKYSEADVIQIIRDVWPDQLEEHALFIAHRESNFQPRVISGTGCCYGLFQIYYRWHKSWLPQVGVTSANQLLEPKLNAAAAYLLYQRNGGWGPWK